MFRIFVTCFCIISKKCFIKAKIKASYIAFIPPKISNITFKIIKLLKNLKTTFTSLIHTLAKVLSVNFPPLVLITRVYFLEFRLKVLLKLDSF